MPNMVECGTRRVFVKPLGAAVVAVAMSALSARAAECPRKDALGTSRVLSVDAATYPRVGLKSFPQTLPLQDHEVVLTFDDGPAATTKQILAALADECVHATFFIVGKPALDRAEIVRQAARAGHTIGNHTFTHQSLNNLKPEDAQAEVDKGFEAIEKILHETGAATRITPFFRYPYFEMTEQTRDDLQRRGSVVFGADLWASDWNKMTPQEELKLLTGRLEGAGRGIILLHDPRAQTAAMLPAFLRYLHDHNYHVVHVVPAPPKASAQTN
jgi:peptidoglycan/xylan/chitin deacetylase (PgdA/CDA1 family)